MGGQTRSRSQPATPKGRRTRESLLEAGAAVIERDGLAGLTIAEATRTAGMAKGTFYVYFADREAFIDALHQRFYARVSEAIEAAVRDLPPGVEQLSAAIDTYLDVCLANRGFKALVLETRTQTNLTTTMEERVEQFARLAEPNLRKMGVASPAVAARLIVALTAEAALIELEAGRRVPAARRAARQLHEGLGRAPDRERR